MYNKVKFKDVSWVVGFNKQSKVVVVPVIKLNGQIKDLSTGEIWPNETFDIIMKNHNLYNASTVALKYSKKSKYDNTIDSLCAFKRACITPGTSLAVKIKNYTKDVMYSYTDYYNNIFAEKMMKPETALKIADKLAEALQQEYEQKIYKNKEEKQIF